MTRIPLALTALLIALPAAAQSTADTYFIDINRELARHGDYVYQSFTISQETSFDMRFASDYTADAAIISESEFNNFISGRGYRGWAFDGVFGTKYITLSRGRYYAAVRNESSASNTIRFEVDYRLDLDDAYFYDWYFGDAKVVEPNGGMWYQQFTIERNVRYFLDGCNSGAETYIIPASELSNVLADRGFRYYVDYSGTDNAYPGLWELELPPGEYVMVIRNEDTVAHSATWQAERWIPSYYRTLGEGAKPGAVTSGSARVRGETNGLRSAARDASGSLRLEFVDQLNAESLARSQFQITVGSRRVFPSAVSYDRARGVVTLSAPEIASVAGPVSVSWKELRTSNGSLSGSSDPLAAGKARDTARTLAIRER